MTNGTTFIPFSKIIGQDKAVQFLKQVMAGEKLPHAYLFVGIQGIGKTTTALALTRAINCREPVTEEGCGRCPSCRQVMSGNFPDLEQIGPEGNRIKIDQIRQLSRAFGFKPVSGKYRVSIIQSADRMTEEAANAFLKTLEEPPEGNILILNVKEPLGLLETIVSRCQKVPFRPIPVDLIADWLKEKKQLDDEEALLLAKISEGSLGRAFNMSEGDFLERRQDYLFKLIKLPELSSDQALTMILEVTEKNKKKALDPSGDDGILGMLSVWKAWYRDLLLMNISGPEKLLLNIDFSHKLKTIAKNCNIENIMKSFQVLDVAQRDLLRMRNLDLVMENAVLTLRGLTREKPVQNRRQHTPDE
jgi:DNA polymerase-3 subunit delta'